MITKLNPLARLLLLSDELITGAEEEENQTSSDDSGDASGSDDSSNGNENDSDDSGTSEGDSEHDDSDDPKVKGLKSALRKEREQRRTDAAELRELRKLKKAEEDRQLAEKTELEQAQIKLQAHEAKLEKLAEASRRSALRAAVLAKAEELRFIDPTDALAGVDLGSISVEQDEDDPSDVKVDEAKVNDLVKKLANQKKHLIKPSGTSDGSATGSQFGNTKRKGSADEAALRAKYPHL